MLRQHAEGTLALGPKMTLGEWLPRWLEARIERGELRPGTAADYRDSINRYLIPREPRARRTSRPGSGEEAR